jgi:hypothetical protein
VRRELVFLQMNVAEGRDMQSGSRAAQPRSNIGAKPEGRAPSIHLEEDQLPPNRTPANYAAFVTLLALRQRVQT